MHQRLVILNARLEEFSLAVYGLAQTMFRCGIAEQEPECDGMDLALNMKFDHQCPVPIVFSTTRLMGRIKSAQTAIANMMMLCEYAESRGCVLKDSGTKLEHERALELVAVKGNRRLTLTLDLVDHEFDGESMVTAETSTGTDVVTLFLHEKNCGIDFSDTSPATQSLYPDLPCKNGSNKVAKGQWPALFDVMVSYLLAGSKPKKRRVK